MDQVGRWRHYSEPVAQIAIPAREYALVFATAALVTFLATGGVRILAGKIGAVTPIRDRDVHRVPTPRMGGVALYLGFAAAILIAHNMPSLSRAFDSSSAIQGVLAAGGVIVLVGVLDDRFDLDAVTKLFGQILAAGVLVLYGITWLVVWVPAGGGTTVLFSQTQGALITVLITLVLANAMNFIDGLDGLLAGVATISGVAVFVFSVHQLMVSSDDSAGSQAPLIAAALIGACVGFLPHNFYPARIFMGDSGSMFIGLTVAASVVTASGQLSPATSSNFGARSTVALLAPVIVVLAVVFIPVLDFLLAVIRRTKEGRHPFSADKRHLHHRMLAIGHTHRQAVLIFYMWAFILSAGSVSLVFARWQAVILPIAVALGAALIISIWPWVRARRLHRARTPVMAGDEARSGGG